MCSHSHQYAQTFLDGALNAHSLGFVDLLFARLATRQEAMKVHEMCVEIHEILCLHDVTRAILFNLCGKPQRHSTINEHISCLSIVGKLD